MVAGVRNAKGVGRQKIAKVAIVILTIGLLSYLVGYLASVNSDAFTEAQRFIMQSPSVSRELGNNINVRLDPFGYELEFSGSSGIATFECNVEGTKGQGTVRITLDKIGNTWRVKTASLNSNGSIMTL